MIRAKNIAVEPMQNNSLNFESLYKQGLLVVLPVPLRTPVYQVFPASCGDERCTGDWRCKECDGAVWKIRKVNFTADLVDEWGETIFLDRDSAEVARESFRERM